MDNHNVLTVLFPSMIDHVPVMSKLNFYICLSVFYISSYRFVCNLVEQCFTYNALYSFVLILQIMHYVYIYIVFLQRSFVDFS